MATITLNYNERSIHAKNMLELILSMGYFKPVKDDAKKARVKKSSIEIALEDVKRGRVHQINDPDRLYEECLSMK
jgi:hypothetical protein